MKRTLAASLCLLLTLASACGSENTETAETSPPPVDSRDEAPNDAAAGDSDETTEATREPDEEPDEDVRGKVTLAAPPGWHLLSTEGRAEVQNPQRGFFEAPGSGFLLIGGFASEEAPHPTGASEEWDEWREGVSFVLVYAAPEAISDQAEALRTHGGAFIDGFDETGVEQMRGYAVHAHGDDDPRRLACVTNDNGTYIFAGLARTDEAAELIDSYQHELKPE